MMKRETGSKTLRSERVLSRGDPNFNGNATLHVCVCVFVARQVLPYSSRSKARLLTAT